MTKKSFSFSTANVDYYFDAEFIRLEKLVSKTNSVIVTDENVFAKHSSKFKGWKVISIKAGEHYKVQSTADDIIWQLIDLGTDRNTTLVGVGGGVVTDITGYVAGTYLRGIPCAFVPTTILAMVDASIGGKNGVDVGLYKNLVGLIRQPKFLLYDYSFLKTLPKEEWINGFAEIIKHACIKDAAMFKMLEESSLITFQKNGALLNKLIQRNALIKTKVVINDEFETGNRKTLNFGHTIGHAIENLYNIPHGHSVSIGMGVACKISASLNAFEESGRVTQLLKKYGLPPQFDFDLDKVMEIMVNDKKRVADTINYILLKKIGKAEIHSLRLEQIKTLIA